MADPFVAVPGRAGSLSETGSPRPPAAGAVLDERTRRLVAAPILPTLVGLAAPNVVVMVAQAGVTVLDAYFVSGLGADALAGVSLVFPLIMLMQTMSAGGMGGGVASAVARALGAGRRADANALVVHALTIAVAMAATFTAAVLASGPALYRAMGGRDGALDAAVTYSTVVFAGALAYWLLNTEAAIVRGTGNMSLPAAVVIGGGLVHVVLSPALIHGWGPLPRLGIAGAAVANVTAFALGAGVLAAYLFRGRGLVRPALREGRLERRLFSDILTVGAWGSLNTVQANLSVLLLTGLVGPFGTAAIAGYGMGARLEYLQIPLVFGFGSALVTMVGTSIGAGNVARAERVAWTGAALATAVTGGIGLLAALFPHAWLRLFSDDPHVVAAGVSYLRIVGPTYAFIGLGLSLYFASQGAGRLFWPVVAGFARLAVAALGGWLATRALGGGLPALYGTMALSLVVFGLPTAVALKRGAWR